MSQLLLVDLFCGAGGLSHGFAQAGFTIAAGVDCDPDALATFRANYPTSRALPADLAQIPPQQLAQAVGIAPDDLDCLVGGPPCQGFSRNRAFNHVDGAFVDDPRNDLYWHFFEYVAYWRPKAVLLENVPEILIRKDGAFRDAVFERFHGLGYQVEAQVLNAAEFGVPQSRRRAFFLAGRDGQKLPFPAPTTAPGPRAGRRTPESAEYIGGPSSNGATFVFDALPFGPTVWAAIKDLYAVYADCLDTASPYAAAPDTTYQADRRRGSSVVYNHFPWPLTERQLRRMRLLSEGQGVLHLPPDLQTKGSYGSAYRRLQASAQALTLTTWLFHPGSGMFTHPFADRVLTIREAARLQSFQDTFRFTGRYHAQCRQVGNAVAPLVAFHLANAIRPFVS